MLPGMAWLIYAIVWLVEARSVLGAYWWETPGLPLLLPIAFSHGDFGETPLPSHCVAKAGVGRMEWPSPLFPLPFSTLLLPYSLLLSHIPSSLLLPSCFLSVGNKKHFMETLLNSFAIRALTDSGFAFLCSNNFLCFHFLFLSSSLSSDRNAKSNLSHVEKFSVVDLLREAKGWFKESICHAQFQSVPQVLVHWKVIHIQTLGKLNDLTEHWYTAILYINVCEDTFWYHLRHQANGLWKMNIDVCNQHTRLQFTITGQVWRGLPGQSTCCASGHPALVPSDSQHPH